MDWAFFGLLDETGCCRWLKEQSDIYG